MIAHDYITEWRKEAPWIDDAQVEQDLVISKALVEIYSLPKLREALAFRGGTAIYKMYLRPAARYSEDIDLVQVRAEPAGPTMDMIRDALNPWLGEPRYTQKEGRVTFRYRFQSEGEPALPLNLKVEINTREHFSVHGFASKPLRVSSRWFSGECAVTTYELNELLGTKLRALYQRKKGRDLFDLARALDRPDVEPQRIVEVFHEYMSHGGHQVSKTLFETNLRNKLEDRMFVSDLGPLLAYGERVDMKVMAERIVEELISRLSD